MPSNIQHHMSIYINILMKDAQELIPTDLIFNMMQTESEKVLSAQRFEPCSVRQVPINQLYYAGIQYF
jgi:hypothetical protein